MNPKNGVFIFLIDGKVELENKVLEAGDSAEISDANEIKFKSIEKSNVLLIEVPLK